MNDIDYPVCHKPLLVKIAHGWKSNKPFIMFVCNEDGRHFRGFISDQQYVIRIFENSISRKGEITGK